MQEVLQSKSRHDIMQMLDTHGMQSVQAKKLSD